MACPFFYPLAPSHAGASSRADAMLPLGDAWTGVCHAAAGRPERPDDACQRGFCNLGYARGNCTRFPIDGGPDAVRFTISRDDGASIGIYYVLERDHHPFGHGPLEYTVPDGAIAPLPDAIVARQAQAYAESYRRRKGTAA